MIWGSLAPFLRSLLWLPPVPWMHVRGRGRLRSQLPPEAVLQACKLLLCLLPPPTLPSSLMTKQE